MKTFSLLVVIFSVASAQAESVECRSANYGVRVVSDAGSILTNYSVRGVDNEGADVGVENFYLTPRILALSLEVDGQPGKIEVYGLRWLGNVYKGKLYFGTTTEFVDCATGNLDEALAYAESIRPTTPPPGTEKRDPNPPAPPVASPPENSEGQSENEKVGEYPRRSRPAGTEDIKEDN